MFDNTFQKPSFVLGIIKELTSNINGVCSTHDKFERLKIVAIKVVQLLAGENRLKWV